MCAMNPPPPPPPPRKPADQMDQLRQAIAEMLGEDPETWPSHGNAPLAIAAAFAVTLTKLNSRL